MTARQMALKRWKGKSDEERAEHTEKMRAARQVKLTPEQRSESARKAAEARWAKAKKKSGKSGVEKTGKKRTSGA